MQPIFDAPMSKVLGEQASGVRLLSREMSQPRGDLLALFFCVFDRSS